MLLYNHGETVQKMQIDLAHWEDFEISAGMVPRSLGEELERHGRKGGDSLWVRLVTPHSACGEVDRLSHQRGLSFGEAELELSGQSRTGAEAAHRAVHGGKAFLAVWPVGAGAPSMEEHDDMMRKSQHMDSERGLLAGAGGRRHAHLIVGGNRVTNIYGGDGRHVGLKVVHVAHGKRGGGSTSGHNIRDNRLHVSYSPSIVDRSLQSFEFLSAYFGGPPPDGAATLILAEPNDACSALSIDFAAVYRDRSSRIKQVTNSEQALERRTKELMRPVVVAVTGGQCSPEKKAKNVQNAGFDAVLIINRYHTVPIVHHSQDVGRGLLPNSVRIGVLAMSALEGAALRNLYHSVEKKNKDGGWHSELRITFQSDPSGEIGWLELRELADPKRWPANAVARRRMFHRLRKIHEPEISSGGFERMRYLERVYMKVNEHYAVAGGCIGHGCKGEETQLQSHDEL